MQLIVSVPKGEANAITDRSLMLNYAKEVKKVGKKKNWIGGDWGMTIDVEVVEDLEQ